MPKPKCKATTAPTAEYMLLLTSSKTNKLSRTNDFMKKNVKIGKSTMNEQ